MEETDFEKALLTYMIHIAESQTLIAEAMATLGQQNQGIARILERVIQTTDRTEQMTARLLASLAPEKVSH